MDQLSSNISTVKSIGSILQLLEFKFKSSYNHSSFYRDLFVIVYMLKLNGKFGIYIKEFIYALMDAFTFVSLGFGAFNVATRAYEIYKKGSDKSKLIIDPERSINPVIIHLFMPDNTAPMTFDEGRGYKIPYVVNRIGIKNIGKIAADNCRGYLVKDGAQERVSWAIPSDRAEITIYPNAREELELAAVFAPALDELNAINHTSFTFMESLDLYDRFQIPHVISPTEQGFKSPPSLNRWISSGRYEVLITYKNPEPEPLRHPFDIMYNRC